MGHYQRLNLLVGGSISRFYGKKNENITRAQIVRECNGTFNRQATMNIRQPEIPQTCHLSHNNACRHKINRLKTSPYTSRPVHIYRMPAVNIQKGGDKAVYKKHVNPATGVLRTPVHIPRLQQLPSRTLADLIRRRLCVPSASVTICYAGILCARARQTPSVIRPPSISNTKHILRRSYYSCFRWRWRHEVHGLARVPPFQAKTHRCVVMSLLALMSSLATHGCGASTRSHPSPRS